MRFRSSQLAAMALVLGVAVPAWPEIHEVYPETHSRLFTTEREPVARINSGDTVITRTWDSGGRDHKDVWHIKHPYVYPESGNPLTGPFYVEGAEYGDALEVHLDKVRLNRGHGYTSYHLGSGVLDGERQYDTNYGMGAVRPGRSDLIPWDIDLAAGLLRPRLKPEVRSGWQIEIPARPMLGCIGVAPGRGVVETSGPSYEYGGNIDYNDVTEGASVLLPVFNPGAYLYIGDAHAVQGDGEGLGAGIETSMDVQFTVRLHKGRRLSIPRLINAEYLVSIGSQPEFRSSMDIGLRRANSDMVAWLTSDCGLTPQEAHMLMGTVVEHKIVTYYGSMATLMKKRYLPPRCHQFGGAR